MVTAGSCSFKKRLTPMIVPVVPMLLTKCVMRPCVCRQSSGPALVSRVQREDRFKDLAQGADHLRLILTTASCSSAVLLEHECG